MAGGQAAGDQAPAEYHRGEMQVADHRSMYVRFNGLMLRFEHGAYTLNERSPEHGACARLG